MSGKQSAHATRSNSMNPNNPQQGNNVPSANVSRSGAFNPQATNYNPTTASTGKGGKK